MIHDRILSALMGLVGACSNSGTRNLLIQALSFPANHPDAAAAEGMVKRIQAEKYRISPNCATCTAPCGNTSDYDTNLLYQAEEPLRSLRFALLDELQAVASALCRSACPPEKVPPLDFFLRALMWIRLDLEPEYLQELLEETRQWNAQLQGEEPEPEPEAGHSRQEG